MDNSHLKWLIAALVAVNAGCTAAASQLPSANAKMACVIAASTISAFLGILSPGFQGKKEE